MFFKLTLHSCNTVRMDQPLGRSSIQELNYTTELFLGIFGGGGRTDSLYSCAYSGSLRSIPQSSLATQLHPLFRTLDIRHLFLEAEYAVHFLASKARNDSGQDQRALSS
jgi:hypothetical protein